MSNPASRLAAFRSYSYYHVLVMCDCSATADIVAQSTDLDTWNHATRSTAVADSRANTEDLGPYSPKQATGGGKYIVLINGSTDAAYTISEAKWSSATAAAAVPGDRNTSIAVEGSIRISEPKGIAFLDQIVKCSVALGVDASQVVYLLKTIFVGYPDDDVFMQDGRQVSTISDIPPVTFITYDVTGQFSEAGGQYEMLFVAAGHGATRLPQYSKAVTAMSVTGDTSLAKTLARLQDNINENYNRYFDCVYQQIQALPGVDTETLLKSLRKVKYVIEVGDDYKDVDGQVKYHVTNQAQQFKNTAGCNDPAQVTFPAYSSIEGAISTIMMMSPQVQADMAQGDTSSNVKYEFKIHSALISTPTGDGLLDYTVYYRVERFMSPKTISYDPSFEVLAKDDAELKKDPQYDRIRRNIITFDYMYTGKNIDILEFDMKVNMGLAYLQTATLANTFKTQLERGPNRQMQAATQDINTYNVKFGGAAVQVPVFFGSQIRTPALTNSQNPSATIQSAYTLSKHASLEVSEVTMRILGNDQLLGTTNITTSPKYVVESAVRDPNAANTPTQANFKDWSFVPAYAKVNIKMPRENDDFALFTGQSTTGDPRTDPGVTDYARDFWFDGYYYVYGIEHVFAEGEFTQTLQMLGIPKRSAFQSTAGARREVNVTSNTGACFDNQIGCGPTTNSLGNAGSSDAGSTVPHNPPSGTTAPTNKQDADSINNKAISPQDVKGWNTASPAVRTAIIDAANRYGVDVVVMAQFAAKESSFNPTATAANNPGGGSSATGLYQFLKSTWNGLVKQGRVLGLSADQGVVNTPGKYPSPDDPRLNPQNNAYAGAAFLRDNIQRIGSSDVGDLYLAHFLGPDTAAKVIRSDTRSGGHAPLSGVLGATEIARIIAANPTIVNVNTTVGELRAWAAKSMASTLVKPVTSVKSKRVVAANQASSAPTTGTARDTTSTTNTRRAASDSVAAVQNCAVQRAKTDNRNCGPLPTGSTQDRPTRGGQ